MEHDKHLTRSRRNRIIAGVCGGIAEYFNLNPVFVRILAVLLPGPNLLVYLMCVIFIPEQ